MNLAEHLSLSPTHSFVETSSRTKGFMEETDITEYDILDASGAKVGSVRVEDHTAVRGFKRTCHIEQRNSQGAVVVKKTFNPS